MPAGGFTVSGFETNNKPTEFVCPNGHVGPNCDARTSDICSGAEDGSKQALIYRQFVDLAIYKQFTTIKML